VNVAGFPNSNGDSYRFWRQVPDVAFRSLPLSGGRKLGFFSGFFKFHWRSFFFFGEVGRESFPSCFWRHYRTLFGLIHGPYLTSLKSAFDIKDGLFGAPGPATRWLLSLFFRFFLNFFSFSGNSLSLLVFLFEILLLPRLHFFLNHETLRAFFVPFCFSFDDLRQMVSPPTSPLPVFSVYFALLSLNFTIAPCFGQ